MLVRLWPTIPNLTWGWGVFSRTILRFRGARSCTGMNLYPSNVYNNQWYSNANSFHPGIKWYWPREYSSTGTLLCLCVFFLRCTTVSTSTLNTQTYGSLRRLTVTWWSYILLRSVLKGHSKSTSYRDSCVIKAGGKIGRPITLLFTDNKIRWVNYCEVIPSGPFDYPIPFHSDLSDPVPFPNPTLTDRLSYHIRVRCNPPTFINSINTYIVFKIKKSFPPISFSVVQVSEKDR